MLLSDGKDVGSTIGSGVGDQGRQGRQGPGLRGRSPLGPVHAGDARRRSARRPPAPTPRPRASAALTGIFKELGYTLSHEYLLRYRSLAGPDTKIVVAVDVAGVPGRHARTYTTPPLASLVGGPDAPRRWDRIIRSSITQILIVLLIVGLIGYAVFRIVYRPDQALTRRIGEFVTLPEDERARQRQAEVRGRAAHADEPPHERLSAHGSKRTSSSRTSHCRCARSCC